MLANLSSVNRNANVVVQLDRYCGRGMCRIGGTTRLDKIADMDIIIASAACLALPIGGDLRPG